MSATTFEFRAMDLAGATSAGELEAESKAAVGEQLRQRGLIVLDVSEKSSPINIEDFFRRWQGIDMRELAVFSRQFATLVASGMPMLRTLATLEEQTQDEQIREAIAGVHSDVEAGSTLEKAMERYPKVFDRLFRAMVRSGEQSGRLDEVLDRIAFQVEKADSLRRQVKSALMYPSLVFGFATVVLVAIVSFVIPVFAKIFEELAEEHPEEDSALPIPTQLCVNASHLMTSYWFVILPSIALAVIAFFKWKKTERGHEALGSLQTEDPVQDRRRDPEGGAGALVAHLLRLGLRRCADAAGDQTDRRDRGQHRRRAGDGRRLRLSQARRLPLRPDPAEPDFPADGRTHGRGRRGDRAAAST